MPDVEIRRDADRFVTDVGDITTRHSFSYGAYYDPDQIGFGPIRAINTEWVAAGAGYEAHPHADVEIFTWVLEGSLRHADTAGGGGVVRPGTVQRLSAGSGVEHTEVNDSADEPLLFVQMMLASDHDGAPEHQLFEVLSTSGGLLPAGRVHAAAELFVLRLDVGGTVSVPAAPRSLVHVTRGEIVLRDTTLLPGDEARLTGVGPYDLSAAATGGEALVWQLET